MKMTIYHEVEIPEVAYFIAKKATSTNMFMKVKGNTCLITSVEKVPYEGIAEIWLKADFDWQMVEDYIFYENLAANNNSAKRVMAELSEKWGLELYQLEVNREMWKEATAGDNFDAVFEPETADNETE